MIRVSTAHRDTVETICRPAAALEVAFKVPSAA
jgi:hypothetical protein